MALPRPHEVMKMGSALPIVIPAPEPESTGGVLDSRLRGTDEEGVLQVIFIAMTSWTPEGELGRLATG